MEFTSTVFYHEELMYYNVASRDGQTFKARLLSEREELTEQPPKEVVLERKDGCWMGNCEEDVLYFLRSDIDRKLSGRYAD